MAVANPLQRPRIPCIQANSNRSPRLKACWTLGWAGGVLSPGFGFWVPAVAVLRNSGGGERGREIVGVRLDQAGHGDR